jgi:phage FluMu gp28-like protein
LPGSGSVTVRSADNPDSLRGEGLDFVVLDECAFMHEDAWAQAIRPALADRQGRALFISTPKGRNWFWRLWQQGQADGDEWHSWRFTSYDNPYIADSEIDAAKATLPDRVFRQEFMAEFIDDAGGVFRNVMSCVTSTAIDKAAGSEYLVGVDWGKHNDFTVFSVFDTTTRHQVYLDRFNQIDYTVQVGRLKALAQRFHPLRIIAERNSMGDPVVEMLQREGLTVQPFTTTNASKKEAIEALAMAFERQDVAILNDPTQIGELQAYEMERTPSGMLRYNAPDGMHDDTVMAMALAWSGVARPIEVFIP